MSAAVLSTYGDYSRNYPALKNLGLPGSARDVFRQIVHFADSAGRAFVCGSAFAERIGCRKETVSRDLKKLEQKGVITKLKKKYLGIFPVVEILPCPIPVSHADAPMTDRSSANDKTTIALCASLQTEQRTTYEREEQPKKIVCSKISEKNHLKESLKNFGIGSNQAHQLLTRFPLERIQNQITNLKAEQARGVEITNPSGWLIKAIHKNFKVNALTTHAPSSEQIAQEELRAEQSRKAQRLLQDARHAERIGQLEDGKRLAQKSLSIYSTTDAQELIARIEATQAEKTKTERVLAAIPKEEFERVLAEELAKQKSIFMRLGITQMSPFQEQAAHSAAIERISQSMAHC